MNRSRLRLGPWLEMGLSLVALSWTDLQGGLSPGPDRGPNQILLQSGSSCHSNSLRSLFFIRVVIGLTLRLLLARKISCRLQTVIFWLYYYPYYDTTTTTTRLYGTSYHCLPVDISSRCSPLQKQATPNSKSQREQMTDR